MYTAVGFPGGVSGKEPTSQGRRHKRHRFSPWLGRSPGGGHGNPLQYSCLENPRDRGAWQVIVHGVTKSQTWLKRLSKCKWMVHLSKHWYNTVFYNTAFIQNFPLFPLNPFFIPFPLKAAILKRKSQGTESLSLNSFRFSPGTLQYFG